MSAFSRITSAQPLGADILDAILYNPFHPGAEIRFQALSFCEQAEAQDFAEPLKRRL